MDCWNWPPPTSIQKQNRCSNPRRAKIVMVPFCTCTDASSAKPNHLIYHNLEVMFIMLITPNDLNSSLVGPSSNHIIHHYCVNKDLNVLCILIYQTTFQLSLKVSSMTIILPSKIEHPPILLLLLDNSSTANFPTVGKDHLFHPISHHFSLWGQRQLYAGLHRTNN